MQITPFVIPMFMYEIDGWESKKENVLSWLRGARWKYVEHGKFSSTKDVSNLSQNFSQCFGDVITAFGVESGIKKIGIQNCWGVKYSTGSYQLPHAHPEAHWSGIIFVDNTEECPTFFIPPYPNPYNRETLHVPLPHTNEGTVCIFPSFLLHHVSPNESFNERTTLGFDLLDMSDNN